MRLENSTFFKRSPDVVWGQSLAKIEPILALGNCPNKNDQQARLLVVILL